MTLIDPIETYKLYDPDEIFLWYQRDYLGTIEKEDVVIVEKGRRVGISWTDAADSVLTAAASTEAGGMDCFYIGYNKEMAREYIDAAADWTKKFKKAFDGIIEEEIIIDDDKEITVFRITFPSGYKIEALSSRPSNLRGKQGKVTIDEAAFHDDLPGLIKAAMALLMWGGKVVIISTHEGDDNYFNELIQETRVGKTGYTVFRIDFETALAQGLYKRICQVRGREWSAEAQKKWADDLYKRYGDNADEELGAIPSGGTGIYISRALLARQQREGIPVVRYEQTNDFTLKDAYVREEEIQAWCEDHLDPILEKLNPNLPCSVGEDFARNGDLTSLVITQEQSNTDLETVLVVELRNIPFEQQRQIVFYILDRLPYLRKAAFDARGNGQYLAEVALQRYGAEIVECVMLSQNWYRENMPKMKSRFEDGTFFIPKDLDITSDFRLIKNTKGVPKVPDDKHTKGTDGKDRHGDTAIASALAVYASEAEIEDFGYEGVETMGSDWKKASNF